MILVALGSNLPHPLHGAPRQVCEAALARLAEEGVPVRRRSSWYASAPVPASDQPWFVNGVADVAFEGGPAALLARLHEVERAFGRERTCRNAARVLDIDLLDFDGVVTGPDAALRLPHPRLQDRGFVLLPLREVAPGWRHPVSGRSVDDLIRDLPPGQTAARLV